MARKREQRQRSIQDNSLKITIDGKMPELSADPVLIKMIASAILKNLKGAE